MGLDSHATDALRVPRACGFYSFDVSQGVIDWSPGVSRLLGLDHVELGKFPFDPALYVHPDDLARFEASMRDGQTRPGHHDFTYRILRADGAVRHVRDVGEAHAPLDPVTGKVRRVTGMLSDITDEVEPDGTDPAIASDQTFWDLIDGAPFGVLAMDADFRIVRISKGAAATFDGISPLIGRDLGEVMRILWPEDFADELVERYRHTLVTGEPYRAPPVIEMRNDRQVIEAYDWGLDRVRLGDGRLGVIAHFYDLTDRVRAERALLEKEQLLSVAFAAASMGAWSVDLRTGRTLWTPETFALFGMDGSGRETAEDVSNSWRSAVHPEDLSHVETAFQRAIEGAEPFDTDFRITLPDGETRHIGSKGTMVQEAPGEPVRMVGVNFDVTARKQSELALRDSQDRLRRVIDNTLAFIGVLDGKGVLREANRPALDVARLSREAVIGQPFWQAPWWTHDAEVSAGVERAIARAASGEVVQYDEVVEIADGNFITIDFMLSPVMDDEGRLEMIVASGFDISAREEARQRVQALLGEINHRSKNILTLVQILARQSAAGSPEDFLERFEQRIAALAAAQDLLVHGASDRVELHELVRSQIGHFDDESAGRIHVDGPDVLLPPEAAQPIGMALHELSTNAGKYGALSCPAGIVDLTWTLETGGGERQLVLRWIESGGPEVNPPERTGFGSRVIRDMTQSSLGGTVDLTYARDGLRWHLTCPI